MKLAFHGATTMTSDIETDVAASARAGFSALEVWIAKLDRYLPEHSLDDLASLFAERPISSSSSARISPG